MSTLRDRVAERARVLFADPRVVRRGALLAMLSMIPTLFGGLQVDDWVHRLILLRDHRYEPLLRPRLLMFSAVDDTPGRLAWLRDHGFFGGFLTNPMDALTRDPQKPFLLGTKVTLTDVTIEVTALTDDGRPAEALFRFDEPLESATYRWTKQVDGRLVPFELPAIGASVRLDAQPLLRL
jgi:hypothetical protein